MPVVEEVWTRIRCIVCFKNDVLMRCHMCLYRASTLASCSKVTGEVDIIDTLSEPHSLSCPLHG